MDNNKNRIIATVVGIVGQAAGLLLAVSIGMIAALPVLLVTGLLIGSFCITKEQLEKMRENPSGFFIATGILMVITGLALVFAPTKLVLTSSIDFVEVALCIASMAFLTTLGTILGYGLRVMRASK